MSENKTVFGTYIGIKATEETKRKLESFVLEELRLPMGSQIEANHSTIVFSKVPLLASGLANKSASFSTNPRHHILDVFSNDANPTYGGGSILVVCFDSDYLASRFSALESQGATSDFPFYSPHISIAKIEDLDYDWDPPEFPLEFVEEYECIIDFREQPPKFYPVRN